MPATPTRRAAHDHHARPTPRQLAATTAARSATAPATAAVHDAVVDADGDGDGDELRA